MINYTAREKRTAWFREARFGMFIHWGVYAIPARGEWVRSTEQMSIEEYQKYVDEFNPIDYHPEEWAKIAKNAGMKYAVLTAKHHDGFCLFDSALTDYKSTNTPSRRDLVREYVDAFRAEGIKVGLYYSLPDWHHSDYPAYGDRQHPMRMNEAYKDKTHHFDQYLDYMHGQIRELCTNYGKIDIMWFDFSYWQYTGDAWRAKELMEMVRSLQPDIIVDDRLGGEIKSKDPKDYCGDFAGPEQGIPREPVRDGNGVLVPWEACITLNNSWGYSAIDKTFKTPCEVIRTLVNCVSKGGNLLVNVGPNAKGVIPEQSVQILEQVGKWLKNNRESIYGCGIADQPKPEWGRFTQKGNILYMHLMNCVIGHINLQGLKDKIKKARLVSDGAEVILTDFWNNEVDTIDDVSDVFINFGYPVPSTYTYPDAIDTVIRLELMD